MHMNWRARTTTALAATAASLLAVTGFAAPAAADPVPIDKGSATSSAAASTTTLAVSPFSESINAGWSKAYHLGTTETMRVILPAELSALDLQTLTWEFEGFAETLEGTVPADVGSFDIPAPDGYPVRSMSLTIQSPQVGGRDSAYLTVLIDGSVPGNGVPGPTVSEFDLDLETAHRGGVHYGLVTDPTVARVDPGGSLVLTAPRGYWTDGPDGSWAGAGTDYSGEIATPESEIPFEIDISADGSSLTVAIPANLGNFTRGTLNLRLSDGGGDAVGTTVTVSFPVELKATRVGGADRYAVAVAVSQAAYPEGSDVAYVVAGTGFADALSAGPAAAEEGGPLLLTPGDSLAPSVAAELRRLAPDRIVVVGGPASVSQAVLSQLGAIAPTDRVSGGDRYEVSRALAAKVFTEGSWRAYVATGATFPDALSAGASAGATGSPVVLVRGSAAALDDATRRTLTDLGVGSIRITGGVASVSAAVEKGLDAIAPTERFGGADRYEASADINRASFFQSETAFLVTGRNYPDALAGAAWAGASGSPLYVSRPDCVPAATLDALAQQGVSRVILIGGPASLAESVRELAPC